MLTAPAAHPEAVFRREHEPVVAEVPGLPCATTAVVSGLSPPGKQRISRLTIIMRDDRPQPEAHPVKGAVAHPRAGLHLHTAADSEREERFRRRAGQPAEAWIKLAHVAERRHSLALRVRVDARGLAVGHGRRILRLARRRRSTLPACPRLYSTSCLSLSIGKAGKRAETLTSVDSKRPIAS